MASLFPLFLKLEGRRCLVVGAGKVAEQKIGPLLASGTDVLVVAPEGARTVRQLAKNGRLQWEQRGFVPGDLNGVTLVVTATGDRALNQEIFRLAGERNVLCNAVDEPENCNFYYPSIVRRGDLQIAISTGGNSPALAQRLRTELEEQFPEEYESWLAWLGKVRGLFFRAKVEPQLRVRALHRVASREVYERFAQSRKRRHGGSI